MGILDSLRKPGLGTGETVYECRNCGKTVSSDSDECPACDSTEIAAYDF